MHGDLSAEHRSLIGREIITHGLKCFFVNGSDPCRLYACVYYFCCLSRGAILHSPQPLGRNKDMYLI